MAKLIGFEFKKIEKSILQKTIDGVNKALEFRVNFIKDISPVDSGDYISSHKIKKASLVGTNVVGSNFNDSDHAFGVEFGFRKSPVNWSKEDGVTIYNGVGANVMQRTTDNETLIKKINSLISESLKG